MANPPDERSDVFAIEFHSAARTEHAWHDHFGVAQNAQGHRLGKRHRAAHGKNRVPDAYLAGISPFGEFEGSRLGRLKLQHSHVCESVSSDENSLDLFTVPEGADHACAMAGDMMVCHQVALLRNDHAAANSL